MKNMYYNINVAGVKRDLPLCPVNEELYIGAFVIFGDVGDGRFGKGLACNRSRARYYDYC